jgi:hypothetical protein
MTTYQMTAMQEKTMEEAQASQTNYFGTTHLEEDSLEAALNDFFKNTDK